MYLVVGKHVAEVVESALGWVFVVMLLSRVDVFKCLDAVLFFWCRPSDWSAGQR